MLVERITDPNRVFSGLCVTILLLGATGGCGDSNSNEFREFTSAEAAEATQQTALTNDPQADVANSEDNSATTPVGSPDQASAGNEAGSNNPPNSPTATAGEASVVAKADKPTDPPADAPTGDSTETAGPTKSSTADSAVAPDIKLAGHSSNSPETTAPSAGLDTKNIDKPAASPGAAVSPADFDRRTGRPLKPALTAPRKIELLVKTRDFKIEGPDGALRVSYDDLDLLKVLNMDPVSPKLADFLPGWLTQLDGKRIIIRGFMFPPPLETGIKGFELARDNQICCFGRDPKPYDLIPVKMRDGESTNYIQGRPFDVIARFHIEPEELDGEVFRVYWMDDAVVIDK